MAECKKRRLPAGVVEKRVINTAGQVKIYRYVRIRYKDRFGKLRPIQAPLTDGLSPREVRAKLRQKVVDDRSREQLAGFIYQLLRSMGSQARGSD